MFLISIVSQPSIKKQVPLRLCVWGQKFWTFRNISSIYFKKEIFSFFSPWVWWLLQLHQLLPLLFVHNFPNINDICYIHILPTIWNTYSKFLPQKPWLLCMESQWIEHIRGKVRILEMAQSPSFISWWLPLLYAVYLAEPNEEKGSIVTANQNDSITRLKRAAATAISAAAVKAKFLGDQEEYQVRRLTALMIEKLVVWKFWSWNRTCFILCVLLLITVIVKYDSSFHAVPKNRSEDVVICWDWAGGPSNKRVHGEDQKEAPIGAKCDNCSSHGGIAI